MPENPTRACRRAAQESGEPSRPAVCRGRPRKIARRWREIPRRAACVRAAGARGRHMCARVSWHRRCVSSGSGGPMFSHILVPTDFSPPSHLPVRTVFSPPPDAASESGRIFAAKFGSSLLILHVIDDPTAESDFVADGFAPSTEGIRTSLIENARARLERSMNLVDRSRYHAHAEAVLGMPAASIVDYATVTGTCLIVMGTHGRTGLAHLL